MPEMSCPKCQTMRAPNAVFCHVCGRVYDKGAVSAGRPELGEPLVRVTEHRMSFMTAVTIGAGLMVGSLFVGLIGTLLILGLLGSILGSIFRAFPGAGS